MMHLRVFLIMPLALLLSAVSTASLAATPAPWLASGLTPLTRIADLGYLNDAPAGKHGFLQVSGEDFVFTDGKPARFWGIALSAGACFPDKKDAPAIASRLAALGFNMVRLHHMDAPWAGRGLIDYSRDDSRHFDRQNWERLDYFINELKKVGIYIFLDLLVTRQFRDGDGVSDAAKLPHMGKGASFIDPRLIELQKEYARNLWTHLNPYTGLRYCDDPVFALSLICNENDLTSHFFLLPEHTPGHPELSRAYTKRLSDYARAQGVSPEKTMRVWESPEARRATTAMMVSFFNDMRRFLRELGVRIPITGTNWAIHLHDLPALASMDFMDQHIYAEGERDEAEFARAPYTRVSTMQWLPFARLAGKPFVVSEWNKGYPMRYRGEYPLAFAAVAAAQSWNVAIMYAYSHDSWTMPQLHHPFDVIVDPARLPLLPAAALLFRQAVKPLTEQALLQVSEREIYSDAYAPQKMPALSTGLWQKRLSMSWQPGVAGISPARSMLGLNAKRSESTDGQLLWDWEKAYRQVNTARVQAFMGWGDGRTVRSADVEWSFENHFAAAALAAVDDTGKPLSQSTRLLLVISTQAQNSAADYPAENGREPVLLEAPVGSIRLHHTATVLRYRMLTAAGVWQEGGLLTRGTDGWFTLRLDPVAGALVYELEPYTDASSAASGQLMHGDLWPAKKPRWVGGGAGAPRCVAGHAFSLPAPCNVAPLAGAVGQNRDFTRQANLTAMGMSAEVQMSLICNRFGDNFGGMCQQDFETLGWDPGVGSGKIVGTVKVGVIDADQVQGLLFAVDRQRLVEQHTQTKTLEVGDFFNEVMVSQDTVNPMLAGEVRQQSLHSGQGLTVVPGRIETKIAGDHAEIEMQFINQRGQLCAAIGHAVDVQIGQVQDAQAVEGGRKICERNLVFFDPEVDGIHEAARSQAEQFQSQVEQGRDQAQVLPVPTAHASPISGCRNAELSLHAPGEKGLAKPLLEGNKVVLFHKSPGCWRRSGIPGRGQFHGSEKGQHLVLEEVS